MIAKRIMRGKAGDFGRLGEYIVHGSGDKKECQNVQHPAVAEVAVWQRTADYIVDALGGGMRAAAVRITNCHATDVEMAIYEIIATQKLNKRARGDRTYHLVVSFPPGETPTPEQLADIEDELCKAIGLGEHQRISAVHTDTEHLHMHIAINQIHPQKLTCIEPWQDRPKLMRACEQLEIKHGLIRTNHHKMHIVTEKQLPLRADAMERYGSGSSLLHWLREEVWPRLLEVLERGQGWQDLHAILQDHGLAIRRRGAGLVIVKTKGRIAVKASDVDRKLAFKALQDRWGAFVSPEPAIANREPKYRRELMHRDVDELFEDWQRLRDDCSVAMGELKVRIKRREDATETFRHSRLHSIRTVSPFTSLGRAHLYEMLDIEVDAYRREDRAWGSTERQKILATLPTWPEFLREAALLGNAAALRTLQRNTRRFQKALNAVTNNDTSPDAKASLTTELKPQTLANGHTAYRLRDGGKVIDDGKDARMDKPSHNAISLALTLTAMRSPGRIVTQPNIQAETITVAARDRLDLRFKDQAAERERQRLLVVFEREDATLASAVFVAQINAERANNPETPEHRLWRETDVGEAIFERMEALGEDAYAALLRRNGEMLVKPLIAAEVSTFSTHNSGDVIQLLPPPEAQPAKTVVEEAQTKPKKSWWRR